MPKTLHPQLCCRQFCSVHSCSMHALSISAANCLQALSLSRLYIAIGRHFVFNYQDIIYFISIQLMRLINSSGNIHIEHCIDCCPAFIKSWQDESKLQTTWLHSIQCCALLATVVHQKSSSMQAKGRLFAVKHWPGLDFQATFIEAWHACIATDCLQLLCTTIKIPHKLKTYWLLVCVNHNWVLHHALFMHMQRSRVEGLYQGYVAMNQPYTLNPVSLHCGKLLQPL